jgi:hypothetical protein
LGGSALAFVGAQSCAGLSGGLVRTARADARSPDAAARLRRDLGSDLAVTFAFVSPEAPFHRFAQQLDAVTDSITVTCTTAGELGPGLGYVEGEIVALGLPRDHFTAETVIVPDLDDLDADGLASKIIRTRLALESASPRFEHEFAFLVVDGISAREDMLMDTISQALGPVPLFGGSAGDGTRFQRSLVGCDGRVLERAAVLTFVRSDCPVKVFSYHHLEPRDTKMVVTRADPNRRVVFEINAEPAAQEYARQLGKSRDNLDPFTFAAHPLVVRVGGDYYVRSIQRITEEGHLKFFSAIDDGVVLTLADLKDITRALESDLSDLAGSADIDTILACDCVLRRIAAQQTQQTRAVSDVLARHNVLGFSTYGEQFGAMHVNFTMTGVAFCRPPTTASGD